MTDGYVVGQVEVPLIGAGFVGVFLQIYNRSSPRGVDFRALGHGPVDGVGVLVAECPKIFLSDAEGIVDRIRNAVGVVVIVRVSRIAEVPLVGEAVGIARVGVYPREGEQGGIAYAR